jgi:hypothetical protein
MYLAEIGVALVPTVRANFAELHVSPLHKRRARIARVIRLASDRSSCLGKFLKVRASTKALAILTPAAAPSRTRGYGRPTAKHRGQPALRIA